MVSKIGNKYFECKNYNGKFVIETLEYYSPLYLQNKHQLYFDKQTIFDEKEKYILECKLRGTIGQYGDTGLTLKQLREIINIVKKDVK